jgi:hypothetical protein
VIFHTTDHEEGITRMKKFLLLAFAAALGFAVVSCKDGNDSKTKEDGEFNFRKTTWGMSREQVKTTEDSAPTGDKPEVVTYRGEIEGMPVIIGYIFEEDKLTKAGYLMQSSHEDPNSYISDYDKMKEFFIQKYGTPAQDDMVWNEGEELDDPDKFGESVCGGKLRYSTVWTDGVTVIKEKLDGEEGKCRHGVIFESADQYLNKPTGNDDSAQSQPAQ